MAPSEGIVSPRSVAAENSAPHLGGGPGRGIAPGGATSKEGRSHIRLSASAGSARPVDIEVEILKELLGQEMRTLIREELANARAMWGDSSRTPQAESHEEADAPDAPGFRDGMRRSTTALTRFSDLARTDKFPSQEADEPGSSGMVSKIFTGWGVAKPPKPADCLSRVADSTLFTAFNFLAIAASCCILGVEANEEIQHVGSGDWQPSMFFEISEIVFLIVFGMELFVRLWRWRLVFFYGEGALMRWIDALVVAFGIASVTLYYLMPGSSAASVVRLFRLAKVLRILRGLNMVAPLRAILTSIQSSGTILLSAVAFVVLMTYMFAVFIVLGVANTLSAESDNMIEDERRALVYYFGSIADTMFSLGVSVTDSWTPTWTALRPAGLGYCSLFCCFVLFTQFAVMNIILGMFVDTAMKAMMSEPVEIAEERAKIEEKEMDDVRRLLMNWDFEGDGTIGEQEWKQLCRVDCKIFSFLSTIGLRRKDVEDWFEVCVETSMDGRVDIETFVSGCMRFKGPASSFEMHSLRLDVEALTAEQKPRK